MGRDPVDVPFFFTFNLVLYPAHWLSIGVFPKDGPVDLLFNSTRHGMQLAVNVTVIRANKQNSTYFLEIASAEQLYFSNTPATSFPGVSPTPRERGWHTSWGDQALFMKALGKRFC